MISFVIPTLNEESAIDKILSDLKRYSGEKEIIISDGKSSDKTVDIAKKYADKITVYSGLTRQNIAMGRNAGAALAEGQYVVFLDADVTIPDPNSFFAKALSYFEADPKLTGLTANFLVMPQFENISDRLNHRFINNFQRFANNVMGYGMSVGEFQMVPTKIFNQSGGYDERIVVGEDQEFFRRLSKIGHTRLAKDLTVYHTGRRIHKTGWPKIWAQWMVNGLMVKFLNRSISKEWKPIR